MALAAFALAACQSESVSESVPTLTSVVVLLQPSPTTVGATSQAAARGLDQFGSDIATGPITWTTSSSVVATVSANGVVTGVSPGTVQVVATASNAVGEATLIVNPPADPARAPWPGSGDVRAVDFTNTFGTNVSGLAYEPASGSAPAVLWAVRNGPGTMHRLIASGDQWIADPSNGWSQGKRLRYTDSLGDVDAEGITFAGGASSGGMYVAAERNNSVNSVSRNSVLRYEISRPGTILRATHEWNLTADLPTVDANRGLEAITWIPDSVLVNRGFFDTSKNRAYSPADYPDHAGGLFFVGLEANGVIYAYALTHSSSTFTRIATIPTGFPGVMALEYDAFTKYLWATCDNGCGNTAAFMVIDTVVSSATRGRFLAPQRHAPPAGLGNYNHEGFALAPQSECVGGLKPVFWADDDQTEGHALRRGLIQCGLIAAPAPSRGSTGRAASGMLR